MSGNQETVLQAGPDLAQERDAALTIVMLGQVGDVARGTMGLEVDVAEAEAALYRAAEHVVPVEAGQPDTCMDDGEAAGVLSGAPTVPRRKQAGGSAMGGWLGQEFTHSLRTAEHGTTNEPEHEQPTERLRAALRTHDTDQPAGAHLRLSSHGGAESCGCGMADGLPKVQQTIAEEAAREDGDRVAVIAEAVMRTPFDSDVHAGVVRDANRLLNDLTVHGWSGAGFIDAVRNPSPGAEAPSGSSDTDGHIEVTAGDHAPKALGIHYGAGTLDRDAYVTATGEKVLWIDEPAIWDTALRGAQQDAAARGAAVTERDVTARYQAIMTANIAGGVTLAGPHLHVGLVGERPAPVF